MNLLRNYLLLALLTLVGSAYGDELKVADFTVDPGNSYNMAVDLDNPDRLYIMTEFWMSLPDGLSIAKDEDGEYLYEEGSRFDRTHSVTIAKEDEGNVYHFLIYSSKNKAIKGNTGTLFTLPIVAASDAVIGKYKGRIFGQIFSDEDKKEHNPAEVEFNVNIGKEKVKYVVAIEPDNNDNGTISITPSGDGSYEEGASVTVTATSAEGYHFVKWSNGETSNPYTFTVNEGVSLIAEFAPNIYAMTFVLDNGEENVVKMQDYGTTLVAPDSPSKTGFTFKGWSSEVPATVPASDMTFTAQWERNSYTMKFVVDGVTVKEESIPYESAVTKQEDPTKEHYSFVGWEPNVPESMPANDVTCTAQFQINQHTMTFVFDNGLQNIVKTQDYGTTLVSPDAPTKTGFTFKGWNPEVPASVPDGDITFTAQWERNSYTMKFVVDGVTVKEESIPYESAVTKQEDPTKEHYSFTGWEPNVPESMPANDVTCTAQFQIDQHTMTFVLDNGDENVVKTQDYASELTAPADPTKTGFTFKGWSPEVPASVPDGDITFTAQWERNSYTMKFVVDGVTVKEESIPYESAVTKQEDPTKEHYSFTGWEPNVPESMPANDVTCTAQFQINQHTMTFVLDNGDENVVKTQDYASDLSSPTDPTKTGFIFQGWSPEVPATVPASDQTFTAQWERNSYKLTWDVDGVKSESQVLYEASITKPTDPEKEGFTFAGWTPDVAETMPAEDVTYTANWTVNQYSMTFVLDNSEENVVKTQDYASDLSAPAELTKTGFTFKGWSPEMPATVPASDQTFTAQWERNSYKLTWDIDGVKTESQVLYEASITKPADPSKEGYTFTGWLPDVPRTMPAEDMTFTAQFEVNVYTIIYVVNGDEWQRETVAYGEPIVLREYPMESGVEFSGWTSDGDYKTMPAHDVTYSASATTGIASLKETSQLVDVFNLRGRMVLSRVPVSRISKELPNGIYIINGNKVRIAK